MLEFGGVYGIAHVVALAVGNVGYEVKVCAFGTAEEAIHSVDDDLNDVDVLPFVETTDVVGVSHLAFVENKVDGAGVVFNK